MPTYRVYTLNESNRIAGPAEDILCVNDDDAVQLAQAVIAAGGHIEIWRGSEKICST